MGAPLLHPVLLLGQGRRGKVARLPLSVVITHISCRVFQSIRDAQSHHHKVLFVHGVLSFRRRLTSTALLAFSVACPLPPKSTCAPSSKVCILYLFFGAPATGCSLMHHAFCRERIARPFSPSVVLPGSNLLVFAHLGCATVPGYFGDLTVASSWACKSQPGTGH